MVIRAATWSSKPGNLQQVVDSEQDDRLGKSAYPATIQSQLEPLNQRPLRHCRYASMIELTASLLAELHLPRRWRSLAACS